MFRALRAARRRTCTIALAALLVLGASAGCSRDIRSAPELAVSPLSELCAEAASGPSASGPSAPGPSAPDSSTPRCLPTRRIEALLASAKLEILDAHETVHGVTNPLRLRYRALLPDGSSFVDYAKWKAVPPSGDLPNDSPRREIAAYQLQRLLFDEADSVVPPIVLRCLPLAGNDWLRERAAWRDGDCALGVLSMWLRDFDELSEVDRERFASDAAYRRHVADLNLFTVMAGHRDPFGRRNFLIDPEPGSGRAFCVDSGITFGAWDRNPIRFWSPGWSRLRVPALRRASVERLRGLDGDALRRALARVAHYSSQRSGNEVLLVDPEPFPTGVSMGEGRLSLGLQEAEIEALDQRRRELLALADSGRIGLF